MKTIRDKIALRGVGELSDVELLAVIIEDIPLAERVIAECGTLAGVVHKELPRLRMVEGLGLRRAEKVVAAAEIGRRVVLSEAQHVEAITTSDDVVRIFRPLAADLDHEECWVLYLTMSNRVLEYRRISQGGVQATVVDNRLIVKRALELLSTRIILVHNHPSGATKPSDADITLTRRVKEAAALFDIRLLDHIIVSKTESYSFQSHGML